MLPHRSTSRRPEQILCALLMTCFIFILTIIPVQAADIPANDTAALITALEAANAGGDTVLNLAPNGVYNFDAAFPGSLANALPPITGRITINGNGASLIRNQAIAPNFRFFFIQAAGSLTLNNITLLQGAIVTDVGLDAQGGAIYNAGRLTLNEARFTQNVVSVVPQVTTARAGNGQGGAIYNAPGGRIVEIVGAEFTSNTAVGGDVVFGVRGEILPNGFVYVVGADVGRGQGGAIYNAGLIDTISGAQFVNNTAESGSMLLLGASAEAEGGAIHNAVTGRIGAISGNTAFVTNKALGRAGTFGANAEGGGVWNAGQIDTLVSSAFTENFAGPHNPNVPSLFNGEFILTDGTVRSLMTIFFPHFQNLFPPGAVHFINDIVEWLQREAGQLCSVIQCSAALAGSETRFFGGNNRGGGLYNEGRIGTLRLNRFEGNVALGTTGLVLYGGSGSGGGVYNDTIGTIAVFADMEFLSNTARGGDGSSRGGHGKGGAVYNSGTIPLITNVQFQAGNSPQGNLAKGGIGFPLTEAVRIHIEKNREFLYGVPLPPNLLRSSGGNAEGGAFYMGATAKTTHIINSDFLLNFAESGGGGTNSGYSRGGAIYSEADLKGTALYLTNVVLQNNTATGVANILIANNASQGGGLFVKSGFVTLRQTHVEGNTAAGANGLLGIKQGQGGGIFNEEGTLTIRDSSILNNTAEGGPGAVGGSGEGGGVHNLSGKVTIYNSTLADNVARGGTGLFGVGIGGGGYGGGVFNGSYGTLQFHLDGQQIVFDGLQNTPEGLVLVLKSEPILLNGLVLIVEGVGIRLGGPFILVNGQEIILTSVPNPATTLIYTSTIQDNTAEGGVLNEGSGAGVYNTGLLTLQDTLLTTNTAMSITGPLCEARGGGVANELGATATIRSSAITQNTVVVSGDPAAHCPILLGAGVFNGRTHAFPDTLLFGVSRLDLTNVTISGNTTPGDGGGVFNEHAAQLDFVTVANNVATEAGGVYINGETTAIKNSLFANNAAQDCFYAQGGFSAAGINVDTDSSCVQIGQPMPGAALAAALPAAPPPTFIMVPFAKLRFDALKLNAPGRTPTHALRAGSLAIDVTTDCTTTAGTVIRIDQRGVVRMDGQRCDAGAYETASALAVAQALPDITPRITKLGLLEPSNTQSRVPQILWSIMVSVTGATEPVDLVLTDILSPDLRLDRVETTHGSTSIDGQSVTISLPMLMPDETVQIMIHTTALNRSIDVVNRACVVVTSSGREVCAESAVASVLPQTGESPWFVNDLRVLLTVGAGLIFMFRARRKAAHLPIYTL